MTPMSWDITWCETPTWLQFQLDIIRQFPPVVRVAATLKLFRVWPPGREKSYGKSASLMGKPWKNGDLYGKSPSLVNELFLWATFNSYVSHYQRVSNILLNHIDPYCKKALLQRSLWLRVKNFGAPCPMLSRRGLQGHEKVLTSDLARDDGSH